MRRTFDRIGLIQIDSVNVLVRSQELPLFARLGPHRRDVLPNMVRDAELFEYWGHEASLIPMDDYPLFRWKMAAGPKGEMWPGIVTLLREQPELLAQVEAEVAERGPISAAELTDAPRRRGPWWGWGDGKLALEALFLTGRVAARRRANFERVYDLPERLIAPHVLRAPVPDETTAKRELLAKAARALGVATAASLADYYRMRLPTVRALIDDLVHERRLERVEVEGWKGPAFLDPTASIPRRARRSALVSPFDSLVWERRRAELLFGFWYRIEIYTPAHKRVHGYYVLPFLLGERLVARVDLKADRQNRRLAVRGAYIEDHSDPKQVAGPLADELQLMASWLELDEIAVDDRGELAQPLMRLVRLVRPTRPGPGAGALRVRAASPSAGGQGERTTSA